MSTAHAGLVQLWQEMEPGVGYCRMVTITTSDPQDILGNWVTAGRRRRSMARWVKDAMGGSGGRFHRRSQGTSTEGTNLCRSHW